MIKQKFAGVVVAGLLLGAGAVNAADSVFPASTNETASSAHQFRGSVRTDATAGTTRSYIPASQNETAGSPHAFQRDASPGRADVKTGSSASVFPASYSEVV